MSDSDSLETLPGSAPGIWPPCQTLPVRDLDLPSLLVLKNS